jgi:tetratricopeptide (TPR) repeat protein
MADGTLQLTVTIDGDESSTLNLDGTGAVWQQAHEKGIPPEAVRPPVYVSCADADRERVIEPLAKWLAEAGYTAWTDRPARGDDADWRAAAEARLSRCTTLIAVLTPAALRALESDGSTVRHVHLEALRRFIPVIPVMLEACHLPDYLTEHDLAPIDLTRPAAWDDLGAALDGAALRRGAWLADQTPADTRRFIGRQAELTRVAALLHRARQERPVVAIYGMGGVGKTMLAAELARRLGPRYPGGVLFERRGKEPPLIQHVLGQWAELAGHHPEQDPASGGDLAWPESVGQLLIVLDDIWPQDVVKVRRLIDTLPGDAACLLTTRDENLAELLSTQVYQLYRFSEADGVSLLQDRMGKWRDRGLLQTLHHAIEGHALALELAAGRFHHYDRESLAETVGLLAARVERGDITPLEAGLPGMRLGRDDSLLVCLRSIREMLAQAAPVLLERFAALGVFAPGASYDRGALAAIWGSALEPLSFGETNQTIDRLRDYALLTASNGRYTQHPIVRSYASALLEQRGETEAAARHRDHYVGVVQRHAAQGSQPSRHDVENIYHAAQFAFNALGLDTIESLSGPTPPTEMPGFDRHAAQTALALVDGARSAVQRIGLPAGRRWLEAGLAAARLLGERHKENTFLNELARWHRARGDGDRALAYLAQSKLLQQALNNRVGLAATLHTMGAIYQETGQYEQALACYRRVLPLHQEMDDHAGVAAALHHIGLAYHAAGQPGEALEHFESAHTIQGQTGDRAGQAVTLTNMGLAYRELGRFDQALDCYEQAGATLAAIGDPVGLANSLGHSGSLFLEIGGYQRALDHFQDALAIWESQDDVEELAAAYSHLGQVHQSQGDYTAALEHFEKALHLLDQGGERAQAIGVLNSVGTVHDLSGAAEKAVAHYEQALALAREMGDWPAAIATLANIAAALRNAPGSGRNEEAVASLREAVMLMELHDIHRDHSGGDLAFYRQQLAYWEWQDTLSLPLGKVLRSFAEANGIDQQHSLLENHPELLTPEADDLFDVLINHLKLQQKTDALRRYTARRQLLHRCRTMGIDQAFRRA